MSLTASRSTLIAAALVLTTACVGLQLLYGFPVSEEAGRTLEMAAVVGYMGAATLLLAPLGRSRAFLAAALAFVLVVAAVYLNTRLTTALDVRFGGSYPWSGQRLLVAGLFVGPIVGLITGVLVFALAWAEAIRWSGGRHAR